MSTSPHQATAHPYPFLPLPLLPKRFHVLAPALKPPAPPKKMKTVSFACFKCNICITIICEQEEQVQ